MDPTAALKFVRQHASPVELARLAFVAQGAPPSPQVRAAALAGQLPNGGFGAFWSGGEASVDATCFRLAQLEELGLLESEEGRRALEFLARRAILSGHVEEDRELAPLAPPWATPGDLACALYLSANAAFWLTLADHPAARFVQDFLAQYEAHGALPSFAQARWLALGVWLRSGDARRAQHAAEALLPAVGEMSAGDLVWLGVTLLIAGVPNDAPLLQAVRTELAAGQLPSGAWPSEEGQDAHVTLGALRVLGALQAS